MSAYECPHCRGPHGSYDCPSLLAAIERRREDEDFMDRLTARLDADKPILDLLADDD